MNAGRAGPRRAAVQRLQAGPCGPISFAICGLPPQALRQSFNAANEKLLVAVAIGDIDPQYFQHGIWEVRIPSPGAEANLHKLNVPEGFNVEVYAEVPGARQMTAVAADAPPPPWQRVLDYGLYTRVNWFGAVLGGNGSSEVRVWPEGHTNHEPYPHIGDVVRELIRKKGRGGVLEFGTAVVSAADGTIAGLLGASPGASTAVPAMLDVLQRCFGDKYDAWQPKLKEMVPSLGVKLAQNSSLFDEVWAWTSKTLELENARELAQPSGV